MNCNDIRDRLDNLWESKEAPEVRQHLDGCGACTQYRRELLVLRAGLHLLKIEDAPQPSIGFADRLVRRLGEIDAPQSLSEFFERIGRRFVYASLVAAFLAVLALAVPSTGPVRGLSSTDIQMNPQEATLAYADPMGDPGTQEAGEFVPVQNPAPAASDEVK